MNEKNGSPAQSPKLTADALECGNDALSSVFRVQCKDILAEGTAFLHSSGYLITAFHVVRGSSQIEILASPSHSVPAELVNCCEKTDVAIVKPAEKICGSPLILSSDLEVVVVGTPVAIWGFPAGYKNHVPLFKAGYLSGLFGEDPSCPDDEVTQLAVNIAINPGDSGSPLVEIESGKVIGVALGSVLPFSPDFEFYLKTLTEAPIGFRRDRKFVEFLNINQLTDSQIAGAMLDEITNNFQVLIGNAALVTDVQRILVAASITP